MTAVENSLWSSNADLQNMKCMMQNMVESMQAIQSMIMSQASANVVASDSVVMKKPKKQSQKGSSTESIDSDGSNNSSSSHKSRNCTRRNKPKWCPF